MFSGLFLSFFLSFIFNPIFALRKQTQIMKVLSFFWKHGYFLMLHCIIIIKIIIIIIQEIYWDFSGNHFFL
jgi:hypothetical protein